MKTKRHILVISGDPDLQVSCQKVLAGENYSIQFSPALRSGLSAVEEGKIDVILLDAAALQDPVEADLLLQLWERDADQACLVLSDQSVLDKALRAVQAGAYDVIFLPVVPDLLALRVHRALERRERSLEMKRLRTFEMFASQLWSVTKGEMDGFDQFNKDFVGMAAFRLTVAHEFRAPLAALQSFLLLLIKGYIPPDQQPKILQHAIDRAQDLLGLVDDLMDLATAGEEQSTANRSRVRLADELEKALPTLKAEAEEKGLTLTLNIRQNPELWVNSIQMRQIWTNLISNAIKYTPAGGQVRVFLEQNEGGASGRVEDTGIGISPKDQALIFHEFYRTREAKEMERRGTGLGLPIVKRIVEGYGGQVEVESTPGKGSCFCFTLPMGTPSEMKNQMPA